MAVNGSTLINFGGGNIEIGDWFYSTYTRNAPTYLPLTSQPQQYLKSSYPVLANIFSPDIANVSYTSTVKATGLSNRNWGAIGYGNGQFVVVAGGWGSSSSLGARSVDNGVNWIDMPPPAAGKWTGVAYGNNIWVSVCAANSSGLVTTLSSATSHDGSTWALRTMPVADGWSSVAYGNGTFVAVAGGAGASSTVSATTTDGVNWTQRTMPGAARYWTGVAYGGGVWIAINTYGQQVALSYDNGANWTLQTVSASFYPMMSITYANGIFIIVCGGYGGASSVAFTSANHGLTWVQRALPASDLWCSVAYGSGVAIAVAGSYVGTRTIAATSTDYGTTWTQRTLSESAYWDGVAYGNNTFIAIPYYSSAVGTTANVNIVAYAQNPTSFILPVAPQSQGSIAYTRAT